MAGSICKSGRAGADRFPRCHPGAHHAGNACRVRGLAGRRPAKDAERQARKDAQAAARKKTVLLARRVKTEAVPSLRRERRAHPLRPKQARPAPATRAKTLIGEVSLRAGAGVESLSAASIGPGITTGSRASHAGSFHRGQKPSVHAACAALRLSLDERAGTGADGVCADVDAGVMVDDCAGVSAAAHGADHAADDQGQTLANGCAVLCLGQLGLGVATTLCSGGLVSKATMGFPVWVLVTAWLLGAFQAVAMLLLSALTLLGLWALDAFNATPGRTFELTALLYMLGMLGLALMTALIARASLSRREQKVWTCWLRWKPASMSCASSSARWNSTREHCHHRPGAEDRLRQRGFSGAYRLYAQ